MADMAMETDVILHGDALSMLRTLPDCTAQACVTSPPYFWQRDYEVDGQLGHEETIDQYTRALTAVFDEVQRILRPDGVLYLNLGDGYYNGKGKPHGSDARATARNFSRKTLRAVDRSGWLIPQKSLILAPWMVAGMLQAHGWVLRSDIIWYRPNAQPEPTAHDRPHRRYEHLFLFAKSRRYYYDRSALGGDEDVWTIPCEAGDTHPAAFPVALAERCVLTATRPGDVVIDPFFGSGTVGYAAKRHSRRYVAIELKAAYIEHAKQRSATVQPVVWTA